MASQAPCVRCAAGLSPAAPVSSARRGGHRCTPAPRASRTLHRPRSTSTDVVDKVSTTANGEPRPGAQAETEHGQHSTAHQNGKLQNGKAQNGQLRNGQLQNGRAQNGKLQNGKLQNGKLQNGNLQNGLASNVKVQNGKHAELETHRAHSNGASVTAHNSEDQPEGGHLEAVAEKSESRTKDEDSQSTSAQTKPRDRQGVYHGAQDIFDMYAPIAKKVAGGKRVSHVEYCTFIQQLLDLTQREKKFSAATLSQALHRLAAAREAMGYATYAARTAFLILSGRLGKVSRHMTTKEIALAVWSVAKFSAAEGYQLPPYVSWEDRYSGQEAFSTAGTPEEESQTFQEQEQESTSDAQADFGERLSEFRENSEPPSSSSLSSADSSSELSSDERGAAVPHLSESEAAVHGGNITDSESATEFAGDGSPAVLKRPQINQQALERLRSNAQAGSSSQPPPGGDESAEASEEEERKQRWLPMKAYDRLGTVAANWLQKQKDCDAASLCILLWSFAKLGYSPLKGRLFRFSQTRALPLYKSMSAQDISNFMWAFGELKEPLREDILLLLAKRSITLCREREMSAISVAIIIQSLAKMGVSPLDGALVNRLLRHVGKQSARAPNSQLLKQLTAQSMTNLWVGLAALGHQPHPEFVDMWAEQCVRRVLEYSLVEARAIEHACQVMGIDPLDGKLVRVLRREHLRLRRSKSGTPGLYPAVGHHESQASSSFEDL